jgi:hypothetical protein
MLGVGPESVEVTLSEFRALQRAAKIIGQVRSLVSADPDDTADDPLGSADAALAEIMYGMDEYHLTIA